jgi:MtN3 and saliva related transmembrane protein
VGIAAGVCTATSLVPQLIKLIQSKKAADISFLFLGILFFAQGLWIWYGILKKDLPIIATNGFSLLVNLAMIVLGLRYKNKKVSFQK